MTSAGDPHPPPLDYSEQPVVGVVTCSRRDGVLTLTSLRDTSRIVRGTVLAAAMVGLFGCAVAMYRWTGTREGVGVVVWVTVACAAVSVFFGAVGDVAAGVHPVVLRLDGPTLSVRRRTLTRVLHDDLERSWIVDVRTRRLRFQDTITRPSALFVLLTNDAEVELLRGRRDEVAYAAEQLRRALSLPWERWLEEGYPPGPGGATVERTVSVDGVTLQFRPPRVAWPALAAALPLIVLASAWVVAYVTPAGRFTWDPGDWTGGWTLLQVGLYTLFGCVALCGALYRIRRSTTLCVDGGRLTWSETGLPPGHAEWPLDEVSGFEVVPARFGRADLRMIRRDSTSIPLLRRRKRKEAEWALANLRRATRLDSPPAGG